MSGDDGSRSKNCFVAIRLASIQLGLDKKPEDLLKLKRFVKATHCMLHDLLTLNELEWADNVLTSPRPGYVFARQLSPICHLWRVADAELDSTKAAIVVKVYDYYLRRDDGTNEATDSMMLQYRKPAPNDVFEHLFIMNPRYREWCTEVLLCASSGISLIQRTCTRAASSTEHAPVWHPSVHAYGYVCRSAVAERSFSTRLDRIDFDMMGINRYPAGFTVTSDEFDILLTTNSSTPTIDQACHVSATFDASMGTPLQGHLCMLLCQPGVAVVSGAASTISLMLLPAFLALSSVDH
eukprot:TRINITY_DN12051_c0_g2_i4.p1 TRINITY_DN12051_c0_g2~~TRINITY_DN12051_c0_g2_i4.p1  ORF type:complete len:295 (+),score=48.34 TRINITY_DN12051_c0_g2_i4:566-1450(+)